ncbi:MAG: AMP-binding protein, partial [Anaerolineales bacterium]
MSDKVEYGGPIVWRPSPDDVENANLTDFMRRYTIPDFDELMRRSTADVAWFTETLLDYLDIRFFKPYSHILDLSRGIAWSKWCVGGEMNIIHNCLDKYAGTQQFDETAMIWVGESGETRKLTYRELHQQINRVANALRGLGLGKGDAIGLYMPMTPEIVIALLA